VRVLKKIFGSKEVRRRGGNCHRVVILLYLDQIVWHSGQKDRLCGFEWHGDSAPCSGNDVVASGRRL